jgi:hypothetical protein
MKRLRKDRLLIIAGLFVSTTFLFNNCGGFGAQKPLQVESLSSIPDAAVGDAAFKYQCENLSARGTSDKTLRRLTKPQLINTLKALVGADVINDGQIQTQLGLLGEDRIVNSVQDLADAPPSSQPSAMLTIALRISDLVTGNTEKTKEVFGECAASGADANCMKAFVSNFGLRVYRRPLSEDEKTSIMNQFTAVGGKEGMIRVLARLMIAPSLVYHLEPGEATDGSRVRLTDYEVASRLSYRLLNTMPDAALLAAAGNGSLKDVANLRAHAKRMLASNEGKSAVADFFRFYMKQDSVPAPNAFASKLAGVDPSVMKKEMVDELNEFVSNVVWNQRGRFQDLFTSTEVFARSDKMAIILQTTSIGLKGTAPTRTNDDHAGLLLRPAFLSGGATFTSPYHRALVVRGNILCETFGSPPADAISGRQAELGDLSQMSNRDRLFAETNTPACLSCHSLLNPVGFALEGYDQLGAKRSSESVFDGNGNVVRTYPIVTAVTDPRLQDNVGEVRALDNAGDLQRAIATGTAGRACFARRLFEFQRARVMDSTDGCALREVESAASSAGSIQDAFVASIANTDIFYKVQGN